MSFVDQLRKAPDEEKRRAEKERKDDFDQLIDGWYNEIKKSCMINARTGSRSAFSAFESYVEEICKENKSDTYNWWIERVKPRVIWKLNPKMDYETICVTDEDAEYIISVLKRKLEGDGLSVFFKKMEKKKYRLESVYIRRSEKEQLVNGLLNTFFDSGLDDSEGSYKMKRVEDGYMYKISVQVTW